MHPGPMKMLNWTEPFTSRILTYYVQEMNIFHMNQATVESAALSLFLNCSQRHPGWSAAQTPPAGRPLALPPDSLSLGFRQFTKHHPFTQPPCCWRLCHLLSSQQPLGQAVSSSCGWNTGSEVAEWHRLCSPPALNSSSAWDALVWPWTSNLTSLSLEFYKSKVVFLWGLANDE